MSLDQAIRDCLHDFLVKYCPRPDLIEPGMLNSFFLAVEDKNTGDLICRRGGDVGFCWFILSGRVEVVVDGRVITERSNGEMIGEQELLRSLVRKRDASPATADVVARGQVRLVRFGRAFQEKFTAEQQAAWGLTLAAVVNEKLQQATDERSLLQRFIDDREKLLSRFAEGEALGVVKREADGNETRVRSREVIVWFSDIANFSTWSTGKEPEAIARLAKKLSQIQIDKIRAVRGEIDKLMGDGVMAVWFIDSEAERLTLPRRAIECAQGVVADVRTEFSQLGAEANLEIRIGMHCGRVSFGDFGARDRIAVTVMGHAVNMAARYEQAKAPELQPIRVSADLKELLASNEAATPIAFAYAQVEVKHGVIIDIYSTT
jgi:class 3 adenylate cyclase